MNINQLQGLSQVNIDMLYVFIISDINMSRVSYPTIKHTIYNGMLPLYTV